MKAYQPRPAGRHVRDTPNGKLTRDGEFTDPNATAAPPVEQPQGDTPSAAENTAPTGKKGK
ncbi:MAG: hypothetical protein EOS63_23915 [Mesorhizobium sp.]|uniref:hypothetical protein n=1 Tax=Mesorhizobium sp. TaxID=1871066 RepID=UPI000FE64B70|nr:hypothetical protein [Mesorhizobium sp.]RWE75451.1 MAG: hypothetical protein EOS63_23915 [Mesorhizobium sp.]TIV30813.1 MAG: hypothetical protein E5V96_31220 [Mesorhizobium sp.]TJW60998.1 MAG: hypothetical protein E5V97_22030 [Mesorhizobium sp.]